MSGDQTLLIAVAGVALLALLLSLWQLRVSRKLRQRIDELQFQPVDQAPAEEKPAVNFSTSLDAVERQQLQSAQPVVPSKTTDKYSYVGSLAEQGLDAKGIAAALQMPLAEVEQLLRLAKLKQATSK